MKMLNDTRFRFIIIGLTFLLITASFVSPSISASNTYILNEPQNQPKINPFDGMNVYFGNFHSHTKYSDGKGTPDEAYTWARYEAGYDFYAITDHAEFLTQEKWDDTGAAANAHNANGIFVAIRGFEWSNPIIGHINVYNTDTYTNIFENFLLSSFYKWLKQSGGIAQFNHPGREPLIFGNLRYPAEMPGSLMWAIETGNKDSGNTVGEFYKYYIQALDNGWMVAPTANQDNHSLETNSHRTAVIAPSLTREAVFDAMISRRVYSTDDPNIKIAFKCNDAWMGSSVEVDPGTASLNIYVEDDEDLKKIEVITNGGEIAAEQEFEPGTRFVTWNPSVNNLYSSYYFLRVTGEDSNNDDPDHDIQIAVTSPIWMNLKMREMPPIEGEWLKGDLHSHSTYSDGDSDVGEVISIAENQGLDYFALTDHDTVDAWSDPDFHSDVLTLLYGVEWTTSGGHANIISDRPFDWSEIEPTLQGGGNAREAIRISHSLAQPGQRIIFSINHPSSPGNIWLFPFEESKNADTMEVWNSRYFWPNFNHGSVYIIHDDYVKRGRKISMVGGSDSHAHKTDNLVSFLQTLYHNIGIPTTWAFSKSRGATDILDALKAGRAFISLQPQGPKIEFLASPAYSESNPNYYPIMMGDTIPHEALRRPAKFLVKVTGASNITGILPPLLIIFKNGELFRIKWACSDTFEYVFFDVPRRGDYYRAQLHHLAVDPGANPITNIIQLTQLGWEAAITNLIYTWNENPEVVSITPSSGYNDGYVKITNLAGTGFKPGAEVRLEKAGLSPIQGEGVSVESDTKITCRFNLEGAVAGKWDVVVENPDGKRGRKAEAFEVIERKAPLPPPKPGKPKASTWYLAEGSTAGGMETWILVANPNRNSVKVNLTLMTDDGPFAPDDLQEVEIPAGSRKTFDIGSFVTTYNVSTKVESKGGDVICERAMYGDNRTWGHNSVGFPY